jgi:hypothetical protein
MGRAAHARRGHGEPVPVGFGVGDQLGKILRGEFLSRHDHHRRFGVEADEPARQGRPAGSGKLAAHLPALLGWVEAEPDITMPELAARLATIDALWKAIGDICALYSEQECWNFFQHAGHASD